MVMVVVMVVVWVVVVRVVVMVVYTPCSQRVVASSEPRQ